MKYRIFIAINLPNNIKQELLSYKTKWPDLPIRWAGPDNLHITLIFVGSVKNNQISEINEIIKSVAGNYQPFFVKLEKVCYSPKNVIPPRMVWVEGVKNEILEGIKTGLEKGLLNSRTCSFFRPEKRSFTPHITLGRIKEWLWRRIELEERPEVNEDIDLSFEVTAIDLMESKLTSRGAQYTILDSIKLKK